MTEAARAVLAQAATLKAEGKLADAEACLRHLIGQQPGIAEAHLNLGTVLLQRGDHEEAGANFRTALGLRPGWALALCNLGVALMAGQKPRDAVPVLQQAVAADPELVEAHCALGDACRASSLIAEAILSYRRACALRPGALPLIRRLAQALYASGDLAEAVDVLSRARQIHPGDTDLAMLQATALLRQARPAEAATLLQEITARQPHNAAAHANLGVAMYASGQMSLAIDVLRRAISLDPAQLSAWINLGNIQRERGALSDAEASMRKALEIDPRSLAALNNLALILKDAGRLVDSEPALRHAIELDGRFADAWANLATVLESQGRTKEAMIAHRKTMSLRPDNTSHHSALLFGMHYDDACTRHDRLEEARRYGSRFGMGSSAKSLIDDLPPAGEALRIGVVSGDLWRHPVAYFLSGLLDSVDPRRVSMHAYSTSTRTDDMTERLRSRFRQWRSLVGLDDPQAAATIRADGIHILIDLSGHTAGNRLPMFAQRPAPVQATWLGYFATTGHPDIDYIITDPISTPEGAEGEFTERCWLMPDTRLCFTPPHDAPDVAPLPMRSRGAITFGCYQNLSKLSGRVLDAWRDILAALPSATIHLQCKQLADPAMVDLFASRLAVHGIAPARIRMRGPVPRSQYLHAYADVDVMLDTFPYPGGTTTCEALWMGVPTLTLEGDSMLGRQGSSLLAAAGLHDWIARSHDEYVARAIALADACGRLEELRAGLRERVRTSPLCDAARFARAFEAAMEGIWTDWWNRRQDSARQE